MEKVCPRCKLPQKGINKCEYCGLIFSEREETGLNKKAKWKNSLSRKSNRKNAILFVIAIIGFFGFLYFYGQKEVAKKRAEYEKIRKQKIIEQKKEEKKQRLKIKKERQKAQRAQKRAEREKQKPADKPLEYQLAVINAGGYVPDDHITIARFRSLLRQLSKTYVEDKQQIADMTVAAQNFLKKEGVEENLLNIMEALNQLFSKPVKNQKYAEYVAAYVALRSKGQSHSQAVIGLNALLESFGIY